MSVAVGISLLSCIQAEIYVISYPLPVNGRHLCFTTYPDIEQHHYFLLRVLWHWKRVTTFEIVLVSCILADIRVITKFQPPSWISDFRFHLGLLPTAPLKIVHFCCSMLHDFNHIFILSQHRMPHYVAILKVRSEQSREKLFHCWNIHVCKGSSD